MTDATLLAPVTDAPSRELAEAISQALGEPDWLRERRLQALTQAGAMPWPNPRLEVWRRLPADRLPREGYRVATGTELPPGAADAMREWAATGRAGLLQQIDAADVPAELSDAAREQGVLLLPLAQAALEHEDLVRPHLFAALDPEYDRYTALSAALWTQGAFLYIPAGAKVEGALFHLISKTGVGQGLFSHTLVVAERHAEASLVDIGASETEADAEPTLVHRTMEIHALEGAQLDVATIQRWGRDVAALSTVRGRVGRDAKVTLVSASFGANLDKQRLEFDLHDQGAEAYLRGIFVGQGEQYFEHDTRQDHTKGGGTSDLLIRGALRDAARAVQYGVIKIFPDAQKTSAFQTMRNLLLNSGAGAEPIPILEIEADDVKCSHAAAVGPVSAEQLFYLQARGIPQEEAERLIVRGFLSEVVDQIPDQHVRALVEELLDRALATANGVAATGVTA